MLSQTAVYALKAALYLAEKDPGDPVPVDDIARGLDVPRNYLSKILHVLARSGLLISTRGPGGGFQLSRSPEGVTLNDVIEHFDDVGTHGCLLGRPECKDDDPCLAHKHWKGISDAVKTFFQETSIADLARKDLGDTIPAPD
jgi:Rrf2 family transcriptional regulator, iron-sulfur cluster assembly transcription factor